VLDLYLAVASCLVGYGEVGLWLQKWVREGGAKMEGNRYKKWMEDYAGKEFLDAVDRGIGGSHLSNLSPITSTLTSTEHSPRAVRRLRISRRR
jgi:hypothetical protein